jgi:hypothetical protein
LTDANVKVVKYINALFEAELPPSMSCDNRSPSHAVRRTKAKRVQCGKLEHRHFLMLLLFGSPLLEKPDKMHHSLRSEKQLGGGGPCHINDETT